MIKIVNAIRYTNSPLDEKIAKNLRLAYWVKEIIEDSGYTLGYKALGFVYLRLAEDCTASKRYDEVMIYLTEAAQHYHRFDNCFTNNEAVPDVPDGVVNHVLDDWYLNGTCVETILRRLNTDPDFADLRSHSDFHKLCEKYSIK